MPVHVVSCAIGMVVTMLVLAGAAAAQVIHTPHDHVPNFAAAPTIRSGAHGAWSSPSTWIPARLPSPADVVVITHTVTFDALAGEAGVIGIDSGGVLRFATDRHTRLRVGTLLVLANGALEVGTAATPVAAAVTAEIVIRNTPLNLALDPDQYGTGLLAIDGAVTLHGSPKTPTFARTSTEPRAGDWTIVLEQAVSGWRAGDRIFPPTPGRFRPTTGSIPPTRCRSRSGSSRRSATTAGR
jgi:hypothetical protein